MLHGSRILGASAFSKTSGKQPVRAALDHQVVLSPRSLDGCAAASKKNNLWLLSFFLRRKVLQVGVYRYRCSRRCFVRFFHAVMLLGCLVTPLPALADPLLCFEAACGSAGGTTTRWNDPAGQRASCSCGGVALNPYTDKCVNGRPTYDPESPQRSGERCAEALENLRNIFQLPCMLPLPLGLPCGNIPLSDLIEANSKTGNPTSADTPVKEASKPSLAEW